MENHDKFVAKRYKAEEFNKISAMYERLTNKSVCKFESSWMVGNDQGESSSNKTDTIQFTISECEAEEEKEGDISEDAGNDGESEKDGDDPICMRDGIERKDAFLKIIYYFGIQRKLAKKSVHFQVESTSFSLFLSFGVESWMMYLKGNWLPKFPESNSNWQH